MVMLMTTAASAEQQAGGGLRGTVADPTGAMIGGARLRLRGAVDLETETDARGHFEFLRLPAGDYTLTVDRPGFRPQRLGVSVRNEIEAVDIVLALATVSESMTVTSDAPAIEEFLKLPQSLHETPRSLSLLTADEARKRNIRNVFEVLHTIPGMNQNSFRSGSYHFYARGYRMGAEDTRVDGFIGMAVGGGFGASMFGVEQVAYLRGPASQILGSTGSPGGVINLITKKPREFRATRIDVRGGGFAGRGLSLGQRPQFSVDFDSTGALTRNNRVLYRTLLTLENQRYFTAQVLDRNRYANQQLTIKLDSDGRFTLTPVFQYARFNRPHGGGLVMSPSTSLLTNDGLSSINTVDITPLSVNPYAGGRVDETSQAGFTFRGSPLEAVRVNFAYRRLRNDSFIDQ
jgi:hypothetical protein